MLFAAWPLGHMRQNLIQLVENFLWILANPVGELTRASHPHCQGDGIAGISQMDYRRRFKLLLYMDHHYLLIAKKVEVRWAVINMLIIIILCLMEHFLTLRALPTIYNHRGGLHPCKDLILVNSPHLLEVFIYPFISYLIFTFSKARVYCL